MEPSARGPLRQLWQQVPKPIRRLTSRGVAFGVNVVGVARGAMERGQTSQANGLTVMGYHRSVLGLGKGARLFQQALVAGGVEAHAWDVSDVLHTDLTLPAVPPPPTFGQTVIAHINPPEHVNALALYRGPRPQPGLRIGYWAWETSQAPQSWKIGVGAVDEIWCPSHFTARAIQDLVGTKRPVRVVPHPILKAPEVAQDRARFGFAEGSVVFLTACDLNSSITRKNPLGAIEAFGRANLGKDSPAELIVKIHGAPDHPARAILEAAAAKVPHVRIMAERLSNADMAVLKSSVDVVLSPHRAEGFGLVLAEAMMLGKPVIATRWSGNLDFMTDDCAALIDCTEIDVHDDTGIYAGGKWAEPDLDHAAQWIARLASDATERARLGAQGRDHIQHVFDLHDWTRRVLDLTS